MGDNIQTNITGRLTPCLQKKILYILMKRELTLICIVNMLIRKEERRFTAK